MKLLKLVPLAAATLMLSACDTVPQKPTAKTPMKPVTKAKTIVKAKIENSIKPIGMYHQSIINTLKGNLVKANGEPAAVDTVESKKHLLIYFSAHWCPPCRAFTPRLVKWYDQNHEDYEIILVSSDSNQRKMLGYMSETKMNWLGAKKGSAAEALLRKQFTTGRGIPNLVLLDENDKIVTSSYKGKKYQGPAHAYKHLQKLLKK